MEKELILKAYGLSKNPNLEILEYGDENDWLELRKKGLGGSDMGAIMGLNKYSSPLKVYMDKVENIREDVSKKSAVRKGKDLESLIRTLYVTPYLGDQGYSVRTLQHILINNIYPWIRANLDGIAVNMDNPQDYTKHIGIEIKVVTPFAEDAWNGEDYCGVPASYYAQCQTYMLVTGVQKFVLCALFENNWEMHYYDIPRDEAFIARIIKESKHFYEYHMQLKIRPTVKLPIDTEIVPKLVKEAEATIPTFTTDTMSEKIVEYREAVKARKEAEKVEDELKSELVDRYTKGERPASPLTKISISVIESRRLDTKKLQEEQPGLCEQYMTTTTSSRVTIK